MIFKNTYHIASVWKWLSLDGKLSLRSKLRFASIISTVIFGKYCRYYQKTTRRIFLQLDYDVTMNASQRGYISEVTYPILLQFILKNEAFRIVERTKAREITLFSLYYFFYLLFQGKGNHWIFISAIVTHFLRFLVKSIYFSLFKALFQLIFPVIC